MEYAYTRLDGRVLPSRITLKLTEKVERVKNNNAKARVYKFTKGESVLYVAWHEPPRLYLPGAKIPTVKYKFEVDGKELSVEKMIEKQGQTKPDSTTVPIRDGMAELSLTPRPVFVRKPSE